LIMISVEYFNNCLDQVFYRILLNRREA
jgi:hypothetical protein